MASRSGTASLPLHHGTVPRWLASRMASLGAAIVEAIVIYEGRDAVLCGWVRSRRDHGGVYFFDLRDRGGVVQIVARPQTAEAFSVAEHLSSEDVVRVTGRVDKRPEGSDNPKLPTGAVEISASEIVLLNKAKTIPFEVEDDAQPTEETRLKFRFLDLRRPRMHGNMALRHRASHAARCCTTCCSRA